VTEDVTDYRELDYAEYQEVEQILDDLVWEQDDSLPAQPSS
jgi:hypothetical protein